ncbi:hypothetical protein BGZ60DRAFT_22978 [Tricladium varicosporioides]|nr:hypothetical protein BGZ60DRAFT_22978 [Hymenoscyphus varicosporioides]
MMAVSAEAMIQILDCLRETQRTRLQTSQSITPEIAAPKVEAKTEQKRPRSPPTPSGSEPPTKRANFKLEDRSIPRQEAQDFVNPHPFESSRLTETPSRFSSIPGFGNIQEQTLPFSTGAAPSDSFDFMSSGYPDPDSQPWLGWIDYPPGPHYLLGPDFIPD